MKEVVKLLDDLYLSIKYSIKDIVIFPGENLSDALLYSLAMTAISTVTYFLKLPTLMDFRGGILACIVLTLLYFIGKGDLREILGSNGNNPARTRNSKSRNKSTSTKRKDPRLEISIDPDYEDTWK